MHDPTGDLRRQPARSRIRRVLARFDTVDRAAYLAVAASRTPMLDAGLARLSNAANNSGLWLATAAGLAVLGGRRQRHAAALGVTAIVVTSATVNLLIKPVLRRARPNRHDAAVPELRHVRMPASHSFPSGHAASAFAFATTVGHQLPAAALPLRILATAVAYSRIHTGVHYPGDVLVGAGIGAMCGTAVRSTVNRRTLAPSRPRRRGR